MSRQSRRKSPTSRNARRDAIDAKRAPADLSQEPCPNCGCPGETYNGHVCEEFLETVDAVRRYSFLFGDVYVDRAGNLIDPARITPA